MYLSMQFPKELFRTVLVLLTLLISAYLQSKNWHINVLLCFIRSTCITYTFLLIHNVYTSHRAHKNGGAAIIHLCTVMDLCFHIASK